MTLRIRQAQRVDLRPLAELFDLYRQFYGQAPDVQRAHDYLTDRFDRGESVLLVAEHVGSGLVGFCQLYPMFCSVEARPIYALYDLFVLPQARQGGVGRSLLQAAEARAAADGMARMDLTTARTNTTAQALYESLGWVRDEVFFAYSRRVGQQSTPARPPEGGAKSLPEGHRDAEGAAMTTPARPPEGGAVPSVTLREITAETVRAVVKLSVDDSQHRFVAPNAVALSQALFAPEAWYRAIYLGDEPVGFVMLSDQSLLQPPPPQPEVWVWRFMVDARHQRKGIGRAAMALVIEHVRRKGVFGCLKLSYVPGEGGPEPLYRSMGFRPTGEVDEGEVVMALALQEGQA